MAPPKFSEEELELLTEEEREGLLEDIDEPDDDAGDAGDDGDAGSAAAAAAAGTDADTGADAGTDAQAVTDAAAAAAAAAPAANAKPAAAAADAGAADQGADEDDDGVTVHRSPLFKAPADTAEKLAGFEKQLDEISQKFDDGDLTGAEYRKQVREIEQQRTELNNQKIKAEFSRDLAVDNWSNVAVPAFMEKNPQYKQGSLLWDALDKEVRKLQADAYADNPFDPKILRQAHKVIDEQLRAITGAAPKPAAPKPGADAGKKPAPKRELPPTLAHVPAADIDATDDDNSQFAYLDRLSTTDGLAYEAALAKLSEADRDRYLAM